MKYCSTRGDCDCVSAAEAIVRGLAPHSGLYVPESFPQLSIEKISELSKKDYQGIAKSIMSLYLDEFSEDELDSIVKSAYGSQFDDERIAPMYRLDENESVLELFHGPTLAFKDMALQVLPQLLRASMDKTGRKNRVLILVATSGDTGKAALEGFADMPGAGIVVFFPKDGVSKAQELQMRTQEGKNVGVCAVSGNFDDTQTGVKKIFSDADYNAKINTQGYSLSSANSINWGRLLPQIAYYFWSYAQLLSEKSISLGDKINFVVPTGNFGNILAGYYAKRMGLPVHKLICASNQNNVLSDFFRQGRYDKNRPFYKTSSPSMDILLSSNLERLLFELCDRDSKTVKDWMDALSINGNYDIGEKLRDKLLDGFYAGFADEMDAKNCISRTWNNNNYLIDTHTAVAQCVYERYKKDSGDKHQTVVVSTASPYKFAYDVLSFVDPDISVDPEDAFAAVDELSRISSGKVPDRIEELRNKEFIHHDQCEKNEMPSAVTEILARWRNR